MDGTTLVVILIAGFFLVILQSGGDVIATLICFVLYVLIMVGLFSIGDADNKRKRREDIDNQPWSDEAKKIAKDILDDNNL